MLPPGGIEDVILVSEAGELKVAEPTLAVFPLDVVEPPSVLPVVIEPEKLLIEALGMLAEPAIVAPLAPPAGVPPAMATEHRREEARMLKNCNGRNDLVLLLEFLLLFIICLELLTMFKLIMC